MFSQGGAGFIRSLELIDTQWDVNDGNLSNNLTSLKELIDTQWDVNKDVYNGIEEDKIELIDTQWDVNILNLHLAFIALEN